MAGVILMLHWPGWGKIRRGVNDAQIKYDMFWDCLFVHVSGGVPHTNQSHQSLFVAYFCNQCKHSISIFQTDLALTPTHTHALTFTLKPSFPFDGLRLWCWICKHMFVKLGLSSLSSIFHVLWPSCVVQIDESSPSCALPLKHVSNLFLVKAAALI